MIRECQAAAFDLAKAGTRTVVAAPGAHKALRIVAIYGCAVAAGTIKFQDSASSPAAHSGTYTMTATELMLNLVGSVNAPIMVLAENVALNVVLGTNVDFDGIVVSYAEHLPT